MNNVNLIGRLTSEPELRYTQDNRAYVRVTLAVDRGLSKEDKEAGKQSADFISCVFWNKTAEVLSKYVKKGNRITVSGKIQTGSYEKENGDKMYTTDIIVNRLEFLESKPKDNRPEPEYNEDDSSITREEESDPFSDFGEQITIEDNSFLD